MTGMLSVITEALTGMLSVVIGILTGMPYRNIDGDAVGGDIR